MLYVLCFIFPPLAVLLAGKPFKALLNLILTICFWVPGVVHAILVVYNKRHDKRVERDARIIANVNNKG